jgi:hypothetical protein
MALVVAIKLTARYQFRAAFIFLFYITQDMQIKVAYFSKTHDEVKFHDSTLCGASIAPISEVQTASVFVLLMEDLKMYICGQICSGMIYVRGSITILPL